MAARLFEAYKRWVSSHSEALSLIETGEFHLWAGGRHLGSLGGASRQPTNRARALSRLQVSHA